jgi:hypothetical protein
MILVTSSAGALMQPFPNSTAIPKHASFSVGEQRPTGSVAFTLSVSDVLSPERDNLPRRSIAGAPFEA